MEQILGHMGAEARDPEAPPVGTCFIKRTYIEMSLFATVPDLSRDISLRNGNVVARPYNFMNAKQTVGTTPWASGRR